MSERDITRIHLKDTISKIKEIAISDLDNELY